MVKYKKSSLLLTMFNLPNTSRGIPEYSSNSHSNKSQEKIKIKKRNNISKKRHRKVRSLDQTLSAFGALSPRLQISSRLFDKRSKTQKNQTLNLERFKQSINSSYKDFIQIEISPLNTKKPTKLQKSKIGSKTQSNTPKFNQTQPKFKLSHNQIEKFKKDLNETKNNLWKKVDKKLKKKLSNFSSFTKNNEKNNFKEKKLKIENFKKSKTRDFSNLKSKQ